MNELQIFNNPEFGEIRLVNVEGKPYAVGIDVAKALGYKNTSKAINDHCKGVTKRYIGVQTGIKSDGTPAIQNIEMNVIPKGDIYRLAANSELPGAEKFESWIFDEVLVAIDATGGYIPTSSEDTESEIMAKALLIANKTIGEQKRKLGQLEAVNSNLTVENAIMLPKAEYFDELVDRNLLTNFRDTAKELKVQEKIFVGFLLSHKYVFRGKKGKLEPCCHPHG